MKTSYKVLSVSGLVVGLIALIAAFGHTTPSAPVQDNSLGGVYNVNNTAPTFTDGIDLGTLPVRESWDGGSIGARQNSGSWRNTKSATATVDYVEISTTGTASSTFRVWAYASSTAPSIANNNPAVPTNVGAANFGSLLINGKTIATSSTATTTSSDDSGVPQAGSSFQVGPVGGTNSYMDFLITGCVAGYSGPASSAFANCETATSSNRGFNLTYRVHYHY